MGIDSSGQPATLNTERVIWDLRGCGEIGSRDGRRLQRTSREKVDETEAPLLTKIQLIALPLAPCMSRNRFYVPRPGARPSLPATQMMRWTTRPPARPARTGRAMSFAPQAA